MLDPRQVDLVALLVFLVVLPVVVYILLGKWSEASKRKERISLLVEEAAAESFAVQTASASVSVIPPVPPPSPAFRECARCHGPATTRCSRCKSVRYCSGTCQIIHWRRGHKDNCSPLGNNSLLKSASTEEAGLAKVFFQEVAHPQCFDHPPHQSLQESFQCDVESPLTNHDDPFAVGSPVTASVTDGPRISKRGRRISEKRVSCKSSKEMLDSEDRAKTSSINENLSNVIPSKDAYGRHKLRGSGSCKSENGFSEKHGISSNVISDEYTEGKGMLPPSHGVKNSKERITSDETVIDYSESSVNGLIKGSNYDEVLQMMCSADMTASSRSTESEITGNDECVRSSKSPKEMSRAGRGQVHLVQMRKGHSLHELADGEVAGLDSFTSANGSNGSASIGLKNLMGFKKPFKVSGQDTSEMRIYSDKKVKVLFPYEVFSKFFEREVFNLAPRGLLNCGNSCYANAVLQCLTCTKPLVMYLLGRTHSQGCCLKTWCLMCELEQHVFMLREAGGPLSPSRILSHIRRINCQIGDGSQEDAHEFLRLLVASMQSICLDEAGGENQVHPSLVETTFVQQTFGGRMRSMVQCLRCHHKSERYENIMDLTLEIFGWVESLEDALTQFTTPEDLDGENMYRCGRCACYVRARKQLNIDEAPNILTIALKRFQEGNYGKINKCISFPEMLDMIPFMTGTSDIPPLYTLYGVVVHVDTLNASFSGHYVSYVKDLRGNWFRIDDSVVQPVPMSQVMSEGAYILFYTRSCPRPPRGYIRKPTRQQAAKSARNSVPKARNSSEAGRSMHGVNNRSTPAVETYAELIGTEFSDATSSDWSLFTSSDEASFTSESTRDSFSTADYFDTCNVDPLYSKFSTNRAPECSSRRISCRMYPGCTPLTRYVSEQTGYILDSGHSFNLLDDSQRVANMRQVGTSFNEAFLSEGHQNFVNYEQSPSYCFTDTFRNC